MGVPTHLLSPQLHPQLTKMADAGAELKRLEKWLAKTEEELDGGKIVKPDSIVDACQALSKARELRAQFEKKEKPLITAKELIGDSDPEIAALSQKCERVKKLTDFYLSKTEACVLEIQEVLVN